MSSSVGGYVPGSDLKSSVIKERRGRWTLGDSKQSAPPSASWASAFPGRLPALRSESTETLGWNTAPMPPPGTVPCHAQGLWVLRIKARPCMNREPKNYKRKRRMSAPPLQTRAVQKYPSGRENEQQRSGSWSTGVTNSGWAG